MTIADFWAMSSFTFVNDFKLFRGIFCHIFRIKYTENGGSGFV
jgi:hypothetical protein